MSIIAFFIPIYCTFYLPWDGEGAYQNYPQKIKKIKKSTMGWRWQSSLTNGLDWFSWGQVMYLHYDSLISLRKDNSQSFQLVTYNLVFLLEVLVLVMSLWGKKKKKKGNISPFIGELWLKSLDKAGAKKQSESLVLSLTYLFCLVPKVLYWFSLNRFFFFFLISKLWLKNKVHINFNFSEEVPKKVRIASKWSGNVGLSAV